MVSGASPSDARNRLDGECGYSYFYMSGGTRTYYFHTGFHVNRSAIEEDEARLPTESIDMVSAVASWATILVEGEPVQFVGPEADDGWALQTRLDDVIISVVGVRWPLEVSSSFG